MFRFLLTACLLLTTTAALAAPPTITNLDLRGLQAGAATTLTITGSGLLPDPKLVMSLPIARQTLLEGGADNRVQIEVELDAKTTPGFYNLRLANAQGVSNTIAVAVDTLPQIAIQEKAETLPVALHGALSGSTRLAVAFPGKAGQEILCEVEAERLGSKLRPVLHLYDPAGKRLAWSLPMVLLGGDARIEAKLPVDGEYRVEWHDLQYAAPAPNFYRLKIGAWTYADLAFPPITSDQETPLTLIGNGPAQNGKIKASADHLAQPAPWPAGVVASGPQPAIGSSNLREIVEQDSPNETLTDLGAAPASVCGRLSQPGESDRYQIAVEPGAKLRFAVTAQPLSSPIDAALELQNEEGKRLAFNDDANASPDSQLDYTVPANTTTVFAVVRDTLDRGGPACIYRLTVDSADEPSRRDFALRFAEDALHVPQQGFAVLAVEAERSDFAGPIDLRLLALPPGVTCPPVQMAGDADGALLAVNAGNAPPACLVTRLQGSTNDASLKAVRTAVSPTHPLASRQPWLAADLAVASYTPETEFSLAWEKEAEPPKLVLGANFKLATACVRPVGGDGPVRLTLLTSQAAPMVNNRPDTNRTLRTEPANIEIAPDGKAQAAFNGLEAARKVLEQAAQQLTTAESADPIDEAKVAAAKKARDDAQAKVAEAEKAAADAAAAAKNSLEVTLAAPGDLTAAAYQVAFKGELLSRDKRQVLATAYTTIRPLEAINPLVLQLTGEPRIEAQLDAKSGAAVKIQGKVEQREGMKGDVTVTLEGLPPGVAVPRVVVKADQTDFELEVRFPASMEPGEVAGVKIAASGKYEASSRVLVNAKPLPITYVLLPPATEGS